MMGSSNNKLNKKLDKQDYRQLVQERKREDPLFKHGYDQLNNFQKDILLDCLVLGSGGMSLPMGSGKTLLSLVLGLFQTYQKNPMLVICAKSLVASWEHELKKFFTLPNQTDPIIKYELLHQSTIKTSLARWEINPETRLIITTPEVTSKAYKDCNLDDMFVDKRMPVPPTIINYYVSPISPFLTHLFGPGYLFSKYWGAIFIDEAQKYTNIETDRCRSMAAMCANHRWCLSGTLFDEPKISRILGYHMLIDLPNVPRNLPETERLVWSYEYKGLNPTMIHRNKNLAFTNPPRVNEQIITHQLTLEETKVYTGMRTVLKEVQKRVRQAQLVRDVDGARQFSSYLLAMVTYLRQVLICPLIPIASIAIDASDVEKRSELSQIIMEEFSKLEINDWLNNPTSLESSRIKAVTHHVANHKDERVVLFTCFRSCADILSHFLPADRPILRIDAGHDIKKRGKVIEDFKNTDNGVLVLTYQLGAEGLNLQCSYTVFLMDFWWNAAKTQQAVARILRFGQESDVVNVYYFTANTGIENSILKKQKSKLQALSELRTGSIKTAIPALKLDDILKMIHQDENHSMVQQISNF